MKRTILLSFIFSIFALFAEAEHIKFVDAHQFPILGTVAPSDSCWRRLPESLRGKVRNELWELGTNTAGMALRFKSNATEIHVKWNSTMEREMNHMTPTGIRGFDLYTLTDDGETWTFVSSVRPRVNRKHSEPKVIGGMEPKMREYMMFFPLYDGVDSLYIGVDSIAEISAPKVDLPSQRKPIVMYGTSIMQGGCCTRPGMTHSNILMRELNREVYNFGFSGNAKLDPEIAETIAGIDAGIYVLSPLPNCTKDMVAEKFENFYNIIRKAHPETPIIVIESPHFPIMRFSKDVSDAINDKNKTLHDIYTRLCAYDDNLYYIEGEKVLGGNTECTVDNYHLTDAGFQHIAYILKPLITKYAK